MRQGRARRFLPALAALLALLLGAGVAPAADVEIGAPFTLTDQNGRTRTDSDFHGSYLLVYFGYTVCPDICPTGLMKMVAALALLEKRDMAKAVRVTPVFVSIDPERDTPAKLKEYAGSFSPRLIALTGRPAEVREMANGYGTIFAKRPSGDGSYLMDHTGFTYLMGQDGRYIAHFEKDVTAEGLADALAAHVSAPEPQQ